MSLADLFRRTVARGEELVFRERLDPHPARVARVARVARKIDILGEVHPLAGPSLARLALRAGLSVRTVHALHALHTPDRPALVDARGMRTYAEVDRSINRAAHAFRDELGIGRGDAVALAAENCAEYVIAWFALMRLGARAVHASYRSQPAELEYLAAHAGLRAILVSDASLDAASQVASARAGARGLEGRRRRRSRRRCGSLGRSRRARPLLRLPEGLLAPRRQREHRLYVRDHREAEGRGP